MARKKRPHSITFDPKENRTKQSNRNETDVNFIVNNHINKGIALPEAPPAIFGDVYDVDLGAARNLLAETRSEFNELPARTRAKFGNDELNYFEFMTDLQRRKQIDEKGYDYVMTHLDELDDEVAQDPEKSSETPSAEPKSGTEE